MRRFLPCSFFYSIIVCTFLLFSFSGNAQITRVEIQGGAIVAENSTVTITTGNSLYFRISNIETGNCKNLKVKDIILSGTNSSNFSLYPSTQKDNIKPESCKGDHDFYFSVTRNDNNCDARSVKVTLDTNDGDFVFYFAVNRSAEIYVIGGNPWADIFDGDAATSDTNGTYFGEVDEGDSVTRRYLIANIGNCDMNVFNITTDNPDFAVSSVHDQNPDPNIIDYTGIAPNYGIYLDVTFTAPSAGIGTQLAAISVTTNDSDTSPFSLIVSAEMFDYSIPGPGGITGEFRLWLKATRGITKTANKVSLWQDLGTNAKDAQQLLVAKQPTFSDTITENINFNPVIKFENNGSTIEEYLNNDTNGFFSQDVFVVMKPNATMTNATTINTIFSGIDSGGAGDITGLGFGDYSTAFTNETLSYNQDIPGSGNFNGSAEINSTYSIAGIINVRNNTLTAPTAQEILYNSNLLTTSKEINSFANVNGGGGSKYWIGRNYDIQGSLNGSVAEIFTFAERLSDIDRQKVESYLAIKYGMTLGASNLAEKDYINSFGTEVWDISVNSGYNYDVTGIGRDDTSDLNQKQSKTINSDDGVTIGLGGIFATNSANPNEFEKDGDFLIWGNNNDTNLGVETNTIDFGLGTSTITRINRKWKIVESEELSGVDVETVFVGIPTTAFSGFSKAPNEEYVLIVADNDAFTNSDIIDVIPLKINVDETGSPILDNNGHQVYNAWYDFHETKFFTFGKAPIVNVNGSVSIGANKNLVGDTFLDLNANSFTVSAWIKSAAGTNAVRTIMAKGDKLQMRLNTSDQVEVWMDDNMAAKITSSMALNDGKWHQVSFVFNSGTIFIYIDGVLDKSKQNIDSPSPNFNNLSIGSVYIDKNTVSNPLMGAIDEVYIWNQALTQNQVRYIMNQEIERFDVSGTDYISGKEIQGVFSNNDMATIPWSTLSVYYDFNSFCGSSVVGLTDARNFFRLNYLIKDKTIVNTQKTPLPYISANNGAWDTGTTWSNNDDSVIPNSLALDGTTVIDWNIVQISHNITSGNRDIILSGLIQTGGTLTIADPVVTDPIENNAGQELRITRYLELDGVIDLVGESQLIQSEGSIVDADSGGYIERDQQGTANGFNYNYWSSSVSAIAGNTATRGTGIASTNPSVAIEDFLKDGGSNFSFNSVDYNFSAPFGSPPPGVRSIYTYWLYKFYGTANDYSAWVKIDETTPLLAGEGFSMKGTLGDAPISMKQNYVFKGLPNNGHILLPLDNSTGDVEHLIGNPYPSAIDADEFILDNISVADGGNNINGTVINGALYFWDHFGEANTHVLKEYVGGYATRNLTGGAAAISNDVRINNTSDGGNPAEGTKVPGQFIPVNQGFFVSTALEGFNNDSGTPIVAVDGGNIIFKNSQRVFVTELEVSLGEPISVFTKAIKGKTVNKMTENLFRDNTPTIRLMYDSPLGYHRQLVIGANENASNNFDLGYDALMVDVNKEDMYWNLNNNKFVIQGVGNFDVSQEFALGLIVNQSGIVKIRLDALENIPVNTELFIKDTATNETFNINNTPLELDLDAGTYNERFKLVFQSNESTTLNTDDTLDETNDLLVYFNSKTSKLEIINNGQINIVEMYLYNLLGQELNTLKINSSENISLPLNSNLGVHIVKLKTENGLVNKKIIIK